MDNTILDPPIEHPIGAYAINPNTEPRNRKVLDNILKDTGMTHHNFEVILHDNCKIESKVIDDNNRKLSSSGPGPRYISNL